MTITKFGQCCLLIEHKGKRILTDPGRFTTEQNSLTDLDLILITHEHADHLHTEGLEEIVKNNPQAVVVTNSAVGKLLTEANIAHVVCEGTDSGEFAEVLVAAFDGEHVEIFADYGMVQNTGYFIDNYLFYPGDAYTEPGKPVPLLALPIAGPWCKAADAINYAIAVAPSKAFPVHDWLLNDDGIALTHGLVEAQLTKHDIAFTPLKNNETKDL